MAFCPLRPVSVSQECLEGHVYDIRLSAFHPPPRFRLDIGIISNPSWAFEERVML